MIALAAISKWIPVAALYRRPLFVFGMVLIAISAYFQGAITADQKWRLKIADAENRIAELEMQSTLANNEIKIIGEQKLKVIRNTKVVIQREIEQNAAVIDSQCLVPDIAIELHNKAAKTP